MRDEVEQLLLVERTLGLAMLQPQVMERMVRAGVAAAEFEHEAQAAMYRAMVAAFGRNMRADAGTVEAAMRADGWEAKEAKRWVRAAEDAGRGASVDDETLSGYIDTIRTQAALRRLKALGQELVAAADKGEQVSSLAARVTAEVDAIVAGSAGESVVSSTQLAERFIRSIGTQTKKIVERAPTGIGAIDAALRGGPRIGTTMIFAAATGIGKTTFLIHMMLAQMRSGRKIVIFPFEQDANDIWAQLLEMCAGIKQSDAKSASDWSRLTSAAEWLDGRFWIDESVALTVEELSGRVHTHVRRNGVSVIYVDYVQDIQRSTRHSRDDLNYAHISVRLRQMAKRYRVLVVESAQLTKDDDKNGRRRSDGPVEDDIHSTRQFAQDSSCTIMADRDKLSDDPVKRNTTRIRLVKDRFDKAAPVRAWMRYDPTTTRLADCDAHGHILEPAKAGAPMQPALEPQEPAHDDFLDSPEDAWDAATKKT